MSESQVSVEATVSERCETILKNKEEVQRLSRMQLRVIKTFVISIILFLSSAISDATNIDTDSSENLGLISKIKPAPWIGIRDFGNGRGKNEARDYKLQLKPTAEFESAVSESRYGIGKGDLIGENTNYYYWDRDTSAGSANGEWNSESKQGNEADFPEAGVALSPELNGKVNKIRVQLYQ